MQKTAALSAYWRFVKRATQYGGEEWSNDLSEDQIRQLIRESNMQADIDDFQDPNYESPLERKRKMQGVGTTIGSGAGLLGGALTGALLPKSTVGRVLGGIGGGIGGFGLGGLGGWGIGSLLARARMGEEYPKG